MRKLLLPFSSLYWAGLQIWYLYDRFRKKVRFDAFTIVVGNLTVGGTGKSPFVYYLARELEKEFRIVVITRGYGRKSKKVVILEDPKTLPDVEETGDEPLMNFMKLGGRVPFVICRDRIEAYRVAKKRFSPDVVVLDDAFQYRKILPDFSFLVFDRKSFRAPGLLLPAGDYRESLGAAKRADAYVFNLKTGGSRFEVKGMLPQKPMLFMRYRLKEVTGKPDSREIVAFAGIGDPQSFLDLLEEEGFEVVRFKKFPDHYWYTDRDLDELRKYGLPIVTTEKDFVRIRNRDGIHAAVIEPEVVDKYGILEELKDRIRGSI